VIFSPGRFRLRTRPARIGSAAIVNTIHPITGIVGCCAAITPPIARQYGRSVGEFVVSLAFARFRTIWPSHLKSWRATSVYAIGADPRRLCAFRGHPASVASPSRKPLCLLFADRAPEGDKQTILGRTWRCPVLWIAGESADMAISTRMTHTRQARVDRVSEFTEYHSRLNVIPA
jgi:hypothetical protein